VGSDEEVAVRWRAGARRAAGRGVALFLRGVEGTRDTPANEGGLRGAYRRGGGTTRRYRAQSTPGAMSNTYRPPL
jgi:hypothetical protein